MPTSHAWLPSEKKVLRRLTTPRKIQDFLDSIAYRVESDYCTPRQVMSEKRAHCFDGALFAAAALSELGLPTSLVCLYAARDDEHVLAVYRANGGWGAVAKSNFVGLRFRDPIYRNPRELVMSYFEGYYNLRRYRSLRAFSSPLSLSRFDRRNWRTSTEPLDAIADALDAQPRRALLTPAQERSLARVDERTFRGGMVGTDLRGAHGWKDGMTAEKL